MCVCVYVCVCVNVCVCTYIYMIIIIIKNCKTLYSIKKDMLAARLHVPSQQFKIEYESNRPIGELKS